MSSFSPAALQRAGYLVGALIRALAVAVACVFPNPASAILAAAVVPAPELSTLESVELALAGPAGEADPASGGEPASGGDTAPESEDGDDDDSTGPLLSDDVVEHDDFLAGFASGDPIRLYPCGGARAAFGSRVPRPSGLA